jgi:ABC-type multidrug transport system fused ATPase/permease subunit
MSLATSDVEDVPHPVLPEKARGAIEFRNLRFRFPGADRDVLEDITLSIRPGERVAFVGAIGAGKSALLGLLPRLYPVGGGMLSIDGVDINDWPLHELRRRVGYVSQEAFLFNETVVENVALGLQDGPNAPAFPPSTKPPRWRRSMRRCSDSPRPTKPASANAASTFRADKSNAS